MFFHKANFIDFLSEDQAILAAKVANQIIDEQSTVLYGLSYSNGACEDFSTEKTSQDTHVCLGVGVSEMAAFEPYHSPIALDRPSKTDIQRVQAQTIKDLKKQLEIERSKKS